MAPNGSSRKAPPAANGKPKSVNFVSQSVLHDAFTDAERSATIKLRDEVHKKLPKATKPGHWDSDVSGGTDRPGPHAVNRITPDIARAFPSGRPMDDKPDVVKCNHCKRPVLRHKAKAHIEECIAKKQEKQRKKKEAKDARDAAARRDRNETSETPEAEEVMGGTASKTAGKTEAGGKKRKAEDGGEGAAKKKKKKDEPKAKVPRPKAPVDVERQCGVELPNGGQCARSLTCKSHSMGAKRAVPGRSAPYDKLLADYQRKNQAKLQKQALESQPMLADDELAHAGPIDSDEEKDLVLAAIARSRPQPLYQVQQIPLRKKYQMVRMKEMLGNALGGRSGGGLFRTGPKEEAAPTMNGGTAAGMMSMTEGERRMSQINDASNVHPKAVSSLNRA
ncbi:hypothetical protein MBLNU459_g2366t2 [Dothideomycetes sp. NU459]